MRQSFNQSDFEAAVKASYTIIQLANLLNCHVETATRYLKFFNSDTSHFSKTGKPLPDKTIFADAIARTSSFEEAGRFINHTGPYVKKYAKI